MPALHALWRPDPADAAGGRLLLWAEADAPTDAAAGRHPASIDPAALDPALAHAEPLEARLWLPSTRSGPLPSVAPARRGARRSRRRAGRAR